MNNNSIHKNFYDKIKFYPEKIQSQLIELFSETIKVSSNNLYSIILIGSTARNELSYYLTNDEINIHGDYEFIMIFKNKPNNNEIDSYNQLFEILKKKWKIKSPLFSIDYGVYTLSRLKFLPPTLWLFELQHFGILVCGESVARMFKEKITINNIDKGNLKHLILVRLWNMYMFINDDFIRDKKNDITNVTKHYYARNVLDILTVLLPHKKILEAGYGKRNQIFQTLDIDPKLDLLKPEINNCYRLKVHMEDSICLSDVSKTFVRGYELLIKEVFDFHLPLTDNSLVEQLISQKKSFNESRYKKLKWLFLGLKTFKNYYSFNFTFFHLLRNDRLRKYLILTLIFVHKSIIAKSVKEKNNYLKESMDLFNIIYHKDDLIFETNKSYEYNFFILRENINNFMVKYFYGMQNKTIESITKQNKRI